MGRRGTEKQLDDDETRKHGVQRKIEEREWRADTIEDMEGYSSLAYETGLLNQRALKSAMGSNPIPSTKLPLDK